MDTTAGRGLELIVFPLRSLPPGRLPFRIHRRRIGSGSPLWLAVRSGLDLHK
jgi:hypothetical protein